MEERTDKKPADVLEVFLQDGQRVVGRRVVKQSEDSDFLYVLNERGEREALPKRLIVRYVVKTSAKAGPGGASV